MSQKLTEECLSKIGITCNVAPLESTVMTAKLLKHEFQASFGGWGPGINIGAMLLTPGSVWGTSTLYAA